MKCIVNSISGQRLFEQEDVNSVVLKASHGEMGILNDHEDFEGTLSSSPSMIKVDGKIVADHVRGGFFRISNNVVHVICRSK